MTDWRAEVRRCLAGASAERVEELAQYLEEKHGELLAAGTPPAEAEAALLVELEEGVPPLLQATRPTPPPAVLGVPRRTLLADLGDDVRHAVRALARTRTFTAVTLLSLAVGIGATAAIFELIDVLRLRPLPVERPAELAQVRIRDRKWIKGHHNAVGDLSNPVWERIRTEQQAFSRVAAFTTECDLTLTAGAKARTATGLCVSGDYFGTLGVPPLLGRVLTPADDRRGCTAPIAVVSHAFWQRELGGDPAVIGRRIELDQRRFEIIGVTPRGFDGPEAGRSFDITMPLCIDDLYEPGDAFLDKSWISTLNVFGRRRPGWSLERTSAHLDAISPGIMAATVPKPPYYDAAEAAAYRAQRLEARAATTGVSALRTEYSTPLDFLIAIAALVLLIACANLANLLLARAAAREREIAVRLALGASRGRILRQLMVESLVLAGAGAALGLGVAQFLARLILAFLPDPDLVVVDPGPDVRVLGFTAALALVTCVLFGLAPALRGARTEVGLVLKATYVGDGPRTFGLRRLLVASQIALSYVLLVGALLFARSLAKLVSVDPGFRVAGITRVAIDLDPLSRDASRWPPVQAQVLERVRAVPGIAAAAASRIHRLAGGGWGDRVWPDGAEARAAGSRFDRVSPGHFQTLGIPLLAGRDFGPGDRLGAPRVAIVNQRFAHDILGADSAVGLRFRVEPDERETEAPAYEIIGVAADTKYTSLRDELKPLAYLAEAQNPAPTSGFQLDVRSDLPPAVLEAAIERVVLEASPRAVLWFKPLEKAVHDSLARDRLLATLAAIFGGVAALLAAAGLYGMFSYSVARRRREIGIRMALGADAARVARLVLGEATVLLAVGLLLGASLALAGGRATAALLYDLAPHDPITFAAAASLLAAIAFLACLPAARRAARVDPMVALRED